MQLQLYGVDSALTPALEGAAYGSEDSFVQYWQTGESGV
jgi:hypothetical protein